MGPITIVIIVVVVLILLSASVKIIQQYEAGVVFRLGRFVGIRGPGIRFIIPFIDRMPKIDTRVITMDVPPQEVLTRDNVTTKVNAVVYFRVINPEDAIIEVADYRMATFQIAQTTLRSVLGQHELDELLARRDKLNLSLQEIIDKHTDPWGIKVSAVEIKDVEIAEDMQRAMAAQAEAERERRAKIVHAEGELQASQRLAEAAHVISTEPAALQLRYLQTLTQIATERTNTLVFPLPLELTSAFLTNRNRGAQERPSGED